ncbi:MAG: ABC transporter substrate-binding protein [Treponema sp.]|jgi:branched-chain amino acid transport system substrate-binding protein|nr:ABC transporter substrate-binding protein [Treponema sp.]
MLLCGTLAMALFAGGGQAAKSTASGKVLKLGVLAPLTGTNAEFGKSFEVGMGMAVSEINAAGGVNGYTLQLIINDSKGDQKESSDLARQYADNDEILAILGDFTSGCCMANAPIVDEAGIVQLSPTASNPDYAGLSPYCFSIMGRNDFASTFYANNVITKFLGVKNVGIIYINSDWGNSAYENFKKEADRIGLNVPVAVNYVQDERDFSSLITRLRATPNLDMVGILDQGAVPLIVNQIRSAGWDIPLSTQGPGTSQQIIDLCGRNSEDLIVVTEFYFDENVPEIKTWRDKFYAQANFEPTHHSAVAYDSVYLIAEAIKMCGSGPITRKAIRDNLQNVDYTGFMGRIQFHPDGDITRNPVICAVENGRYVLRAGVNYKFD